MRLSSILPYRDFFPMVSDVTQELNALSSWSALIFLGLARKSFAVLPTLTLSARDLTHVKHVVYSTRVCVEIFRLFTF